MPLTSTKTIFYIALGSMIAGLLLLGGVFYLIYSKEEGLATLEQELAVLEQSQSSATGIRHLLSDTKVEREQLAGFLVSKDGVAKFIESVEDLAKLTKTSVSVNSVGVTPLKGDRFENVLLTAEARGSFENVYWLLSLIEKIPQQLQVQKVFVEKLPAEDKKTPPNWRLIFTLQALKLK